MTKINTYKLAHYQQISQQILLIHMERVSAISYSHPQQALIYFLEDSLQRKYIPHVPVQITNIFPLTNLNRCF